MISWESDMGKALARGIAEQKSVLLEFFSHDCIGCQQMEEVTFADADVINFISSHMVPLRIPVTNEALAADFRVFWTPTLIVIDYYGKEHQRTLGYLPPEETVASFLLGIGKVSLGYGQFNEAVIQFNTLLNGCPRSAVAAEAVYLRGVARYKASQALSALKETYQFLLVKYPESEWTRRAAPFNLL